MRQRWLVVALAAGGALASVGSCSSGKEAPDAGGGAAGTSAGGGTGATGGGIAGGAGGLGPGSAGAAGLAGHAGAGGGGAAAVRATCMGLAVDNRTPGAIANPEDFSTNLDTGARDQHTLWMGRADMVRRVLSYETQGAADHTHVVTFTDAELNTLLGGGSATVTTQGPSTAATGHVHMVVVSSCGATQGFGGAAGAIK